VHTAREDAIHFIGAGHHATERFGVQALCERLAQEFDVTWEYVEIDNPA
jgi:putative NIF3 family GTP cyclohydrolase 1 type 2